MTGAARPGGALYPVLMILGILVALGAMLPQVLVQASVGIRRDRGRDDLAVALDAAIAFAEARLKQALTDQLRLGREPRVSTYTVSPGIENPDYGLRRSVSWEARLVRVQRLDVPEEPCVEPRPQTFSYRLEAAAWETGPPRRRAGVEVNGLVTVAPAQDPASSTVRFEPIETPRDDVPLGPSPAASPLR